MMTDDEYRRRSDEDFRFLVLCEMKRNRGMYELMRDRELEAERKRRNEKMPEVWQEVWQGDEQ